MHTRKITNPVVPVQDFIGTRFGRLVVTSFVGLRSVGATCRRRFWECLCDCGEIVELHTNSLTTGNTQSCGCLNRELRKKRKPRLKHGLTGTSEYTAWSAMLGRCHNTEHRAYADYGARGILVCERWQNSFENFIADMGRKPSAKHTLERKNNNLGYDPENCCWADWFDQAHNRRNSRLLTLNGETHCIHEWERMLGFSSGVLRYRLNHGWSVEKTLTTPNTANNKRKQR